MPSDCGERTIGHFAVVNYISGPLADFLNSLRVDLRPYSMPRAHVTILPPRLPAGITEEAVETFKHQLARDASSVPPFTVRLGEVGIFEKSHVVYLSLERGENEIRTLHRRLNQGPLEFTCKFDFHPHITVVQDIVPEDAARLVSAAQARWRDYTGPREFLVEDLSFVRNVGGRWQDLATTPLAEPVRA